MLWCWFFWIQLGHYPSGLLGSLQPGSKRVLKAMLQSSGIPFLSPSAFASGGIMGLPRRADACISAAPASLLLGSGVLDLCFSHPTHRSRVGVPSTEVGRKPRKKHSCIFCSSPAPFFPVRVTTPSLPTPTERSEVSLNQQLWILAVLLMVCIFLHQRAKSLRDTEKMIDNTASKQGKKKKKGSNAHEFQMMIF